MDTSKVIELCCVSEETQGNHIVDVESFSDPSPGPFVG